MSFERALPFVLRMEGGYVNDPDDPGGATNKGITQATYTAWLGPEGPKDVRNISDAAVADIYKTRYWLAAQCHRLPWPLSLAHFDASVNHGVGRAIKLLQDAAGATPDGVWGPETEAKAGPLTVDAQLWRRLQFYYEITSKKPQLNKFLLGWLRRVLKLREACST